MHAWEVIGYVFDGAAYCPRCEPVNRDEADRDEVSPIFAEHHDETIGTTCDQCGRCYTDDGWYTHADAVNPVLVIWSRCSHCNAQWPNLRGDAAEHARDARRFGCTSCSRKESVFLIPHQRAR